MSGGDGIREDGGWWAGDPNRAILWAVIGNGVSLAALMLVLAGGLNGRIDRLHTSVNASLNDLNASVNGSLDDLNANLDDLQDDIRELRELVIQALNESSAAD